MRRLSDCLAMTLVGALLIGYCAFQILFLGTFIDNAREPSAELRLIELAAHAEGRMWGFIVSIPVILTILGFVWHGHHQHLCDQERSRHKQN